MTIPARPRGPGYYEHINLGAHRIEFVPECRVGDSGKTRAALSAWNLQAAKVRRQEDSRRISEAIVAKAEAQPGRGILDKVRALLGERAR